MRISKGKSRIIILVIAYLMLAHFVVGLYFTFRLFGAVDSLVAGFWFSVPYGMIAAIFLMSIIAGHTRRPLWSSMSCLLGLLAGALLCVYDLQHNRYQLTGGGSGPMYTIWWWYYEPWIKGYEPGNL